MKKILLIISSTLILGNLIAQVNPDLNRLVIRATAEVTENPPSIELNWMNSTATGSGYVISRRTNNSGIWKSVATPAISATSFLDEDVVVGEEYEYQIGKVNGASLVSWGYVNAGIKHLPELMNRGVILVLDTLVTDSLELEVERLIEDFKADGFEVAVIGSNRNDLVSTLKSRIKDIYDQNPNVYNSLLLLGHVPVAYSGDLNPDAHNNHKGAWSADIFYGELNGTWTDVTVLDTSASRAVNRNVPGDGKYDQSVVPSDLELELGRVDFYDMPAFSLDEIELLRKYLDKNHAFRNKDFVPGRRALMDEGSFANSAAGEGFGQSGPRAMIPLVGEDSFYVADYFTELTKGSYLWSYGQGAGSYTSCSGIGNTSDFVSDSVQSVFTMLFGSYFGDYDSRNNFMRASLGSGTILTCSWSSSRPVWYYHHMAMGHTVGYSARKSVNYDNSYRSINFGPSFPTTKGVHTVLLGDPTLRPFYITGPSNLIAEDNGSGDADLTWDASNESNILGYNIYRSHADSIAYRLINQQPITNTQFTDMNISEDGVYRYFVRAVTLETTASGTYMNESPGVSDTAMIVNAVGINNQTAALSLTISPNPSDGLYRINTSQKVLRYEVFNLNGQLIRSRQNENEIKLFDQPTGVYFVRTFLQNEVHNTKIILE